MDLYEVAHFSNGWIIRNTKTQKHEIIVHETHKRAMWVCEALNQTLRNEETAFTRGG